ncbi:trypco2 family protein [Actinoplanes sp. NPDC024001]|uniref:trypco2 family protein n=1 Tax=Actinoplanes sp. NPDC024001 TaxID=3154598 RepID=UPI0033F95B65
MSDGSAGIVGLADSIEALRAQLTEAVNRGAGQSMLFQLSPIELELQAVVTKDVNGEIGWSLVGAGGSSGAATTQTLRLTLTPLWKGPDGLPTSNFAVAEQSEPGPRFGARD